MTSHRPNFLIAGAAKSGTTSLHEYLKQHPQIYMTDYKEPGYFTHGYGMKKWDDYLALFRNAAGKKAIAESSTLYLYSQESAQWIKSVLGNIKIILLLRNPAQRAYSLYTWMLHKGFENAPTFTHALQREPARLADPDFPHRCPHVLPDYLYYTSGLYSEQVRRYLDTFGRDQVRIYLFEDFVERPLQICQDAFEFLDVDPDFEPRIEVHNAGWAPASIPFQYWLRTKSRRHLGFLPRKIRQRLVNRMLAWNNQRGHKPEPDREALEALAERYRDDISQLENLLDCDLSKWYERALCCPQPC